MTTATSNTTARLVAARKAFRAGKVNRAVRAAAKCGIWATNDRTWEIVVSRLTGSVYGYDAADVLAVSTAVAR